MAITYPKLTSLKDAAALRSRMAELGWRVPVDNEVLSATEGSPLAWPMSVGGITVGNRWCIHPMEGWDAQPDGSPSPLTLRRWRNFGLSGAKLIWGGEAAAVRADGRANPRQTLATPAHREGLAALLKSLREAHQASFGSLDGLLVGLQLTHSGRFSRPTAAGLAPRIAYHHPLLDAKFGIDPSDDSIVWTDEQLDALVDDFVASARVARDVGYQFVDVKACHGYLLHEFLSARSRPGRYGGDLTGRMRLLTTIIERIRAELPGLMVGVRLSVFDTVPYVTSGDVGRPMPYDAHLPYELGFGVDRDDPLRMDLAEPFEMLRRLQSLGVAIVNVSCGSPYYCPHIQRPASYPPSDGYQPPEDPLAGVCRQIEAVRACRAAVPGLPVVGTGYTYLQEYLPHVAQAVVREGWTDFVGVGRLVLSYPELPADALAGRALAFKRICRTFSDCTTAPRHGLVSGCYPLDPEYKGMPEAGQVREIKRKV